MKSRLKFFLALGLSVTLMSAATAAQKAAEEKKPAAQVGQPAPAFTLKDTKGTEHKLEDYKGKIVVLEWVNPQCPVCRMAHEDGRVASMVKTFKEMDDVVFLGINSSYTTTAEENDSALDRYKIEYPVLLDVEGTVARLYGARTTPHLYVIDPEGVLRYQGALDNDHTGNKTRDGEAVTNYALNAVKQIQAGETVSPETTRSYGCNVKYAPKGKAKGKSDTRPGRNRDRQQ